MSNNITVEQIKKLASVDDLELYSYVTDRAEKISDEIVEQILRNSKNEGGLILVYGPQNSGKTIIACSVLDSLAKTDVVVAATQQDVDRPDVPVDRLYSRSGVEKRVKSFTNKQDLETIFGKNDVVIVDEIQFVLSEMQSFFLKEVMHFIARGGWLVAIGCLYTAQGAEFLLPAILKERSIKSYEVTSTCQKCGSRGAKLNQRLVDGKPTSSDDPELIAPSHTVTYEPRCDECRVVFG